MPTIKKTQAKFVAAFIFAALNLHLTAVCGNICQICTSGPHSWVGQPAAASERSLGQPQERFTGFPHAALPGNDFLTLSKILYIQDNRTKEHCL